MKVNFSKKKSKTGWDRLHYMSDPEIDYSEIPSLDKEFFQKGKLRTPKPKPLISMRLDTDVLEWFKSFGERGTGLKKTQFFVCI